MGQVPLPAAPQGGVQHDPLREEWARRSAIHSRPEDPVSNKARDHARNNAQIMLT